MECSNFPLDEEDCKACKNNPCFVSDNHNTSTKSKTTNNSLGTLLGERVKLPKDINKWSVIAWTILAVLLLLNLVSNAL